MSAEPDRNPTEPDPTSGAPRAPTGESPQATGEPQGEAPAGGAAQVPQETMRRAVTEAQVRKTAAGLAKARAGARKAAADAELAELKLQHAKEKAKATAEGKPVPLPSSVASLPPEGVEKCRAALQVAERAGKPFTSWPQLRKAAAVDTATANPVWAAYKAGLMPPLEAPWVSGQAPTGRVLPRGKKASDLMARVRSAKTPGEVASITAEVTALQIAGEFDRASASGVLEGCAEMRKGMEAMAKRLDPLAAPDDRRMGLVSEDAFTAAKSIDHLDDDRREMVFSFIGEMLEQENEAAKERAPRDEAKE